ncbi:hypothetical protein Daura_21720 [Dactylosporangium aurantiacum]|uniref:Uncharacterized protein n=1 Tax=Dactylosporangium aurantiacum TaxID=35754 RepID=A0A9Q9ILX9_9ACTN|nr:hypothetical protein [Dactylosporangium aurantiacum]MDG6110322.1 hypothetical protein [Dactylosporangium aurantiacum]UWZ58559.1 hypothetical protein Daura_21720 [Dactylosporangium aurantiacum]
MARPTASPDGPDDGLADALLSISRATVTLAARNLNQLDADVTLQQYRTLVILTCGGHANGDVAAGAGGRFSGPAADAAHRRCTPMASQRVRVPATAW